MNGFILRRLAQIIPTVLVATFLVFMLLQMVPGDAAQVIAGESASIERVAEIRQQLGLDQPIPVQYLRWLGKAVSGDLGESILSGKPVLQLVGSHFLVTAELVVEAAVLATVAGLLLGILSATAGESPLGTAARGIAVLFLSIPSFVLAMVLVVVFSLMLRWFPATGFTSLFDNPAGVIRHAALPVIAIALVGVGEIARQTSTALAATLTSDVVRTHRGKGLSTYRVLAHAVHNIGVLILTLVSLLVNRFLGATVLVETIFAIPGAGQLVVDAVNDRDFPIVQGTVLFMVLAVMLVNLLTDLAYRRVDPRIQF